MSVAETIRVKLVAALRPARLVIKDESHLHAGHAGARDGGESHFRVLVVSPLFEGQPQVARQRAVNAALKEELAGPVHALALKTLTPAEFSAAE
jgi:BolA protein